MKRQDFGLWGLDLSEGKFAQALAAAGALAGEKSPKLRTGYDVRQAVDALDRIAQSGELITPCEFSGSLLELVAKPPLAGKAELLAEAWSSSKLCAKSARFLLKGFTSIVEPFSNPTDSGWLVDQLCRPEVNLASAFFSLEQEQAHIAWQWPLRIGMLPHPASMRLQAQFRKELRNHPWLKKLINFLTLDQDSNECDLFLVPLDSPINLIQMLRRSSVVADCTLALGSQRQVAESSAILVPALKHFVRTSGVGLVTLNPEDERQWFTSLIRRISHNDTIDVAVCSSSREIGASAPLISASERLLRFARLSESVKAVGERYMLSGPATITRIKQGSAAEHVLDLAPGPHPGTIVGQLLTSAPETAYGSESQMATVLAEVIGGFRASPGTEPPAPQPRYIQAQVRDASKPADSKPLLTAFVPQCPHSIRIRIGFRNIEWLSPVEGEEFPANALPTDQARYTLRVDLVELPESGSSARSTIELPQSGESTSCEFFVKTGPEKTQFKARIFVSYKGRILQSAILTGPVTTAPSPGGIQLAVEIAVRPNFDDLETQRQYKAAIVETEQTTVHSEKGVDVIAGDNLQDLINWIDNALSEIAYQRQEFEGGLTSAATVDLLRMLAKHGSMLYEAVFPEKPSDPDWNGRIQVVSTTEAARLPVEFFYERKAPLKGAPLCPNALAALREGKCPPSCKPEDNSIICPLGFWGMSRIIERHAEDPKSPRKLARDFRLQAEPSYPQHCLHILKEGLVATTNRVDKTVAGGSAAVADAVSKAVGAKDPCQPIKNWAKWVEHIKSASPSLLVMIVHTQRPPGSLIQEIEIGDGDWLDASNIEKEHVRDPLTKPEPLVILIGCEAGAPKLSCLGFVAKLRSRGAAIVVTSGSTIHATHAVPVTKGLIETLGELDISADKTFGEIMRSLRREMLAAGNPMVLCLTAYGDANWRIAR